MKKRESSIHNTAYIQLSYAGRDAYAANWCDKASTKRHLVGHSRESLIHALSGEPASADRATCRENLVDLIAMAILDSTDVDVSVETQAEAVLNAILDSCLPMPATGDDRG
jgi:hypothetical protein